MTEDAEDKEFEEFRKSMRPSHGLRLFHWDWGMAISAVVITAGLVLFYLVYTGKFR